MIDSRTVSGNTWEIIDSFSKEDILSALSLLKERLKNRGYKDAYKTDEEIIDECFKIRRDKK